MQHVIVQTGFRESGPKGLPWSVDSGQGGTAVFAYADSRRDLAVVTSEEAFPVAFNVATEQPKLGDEVFVAGFDFDKKGLPRKTTRAKVVGFLAGSVILDKSAGQGSSGGCVFDSENHVIGVMQATLRSDRQESGLVTAVYPPWFPVHEKWRDSVSGNIVGIEDIGLHPFSRFWEMAHLNQGFP